MWDVPRFVSNRIICHVNLLSDLPRGLMIVILSCGMFCERPFLVQMTRVNTRRITMFSCVAALPFLTPPPSLILSHSIGSRDTNVPSEYFRVVNKSGLTQWEPDWN